MSTEPKNPEDNPFAAGDDPFAASAGADPFASAGDPFAPDERAEYWAAVSEEAEEEDSPEGAAKRVLTEVELAFKERARAEEQRVMEAVDSEFWIALIFQTRAQKDEFLRACGADRALAGDKYIDGFAFAKLIGKPVTAVKVRYNISEKLDRKLVDMSRGLDELTGLSPPNPQEGA